MYGFVSFWGFFVFVCFYKVTVEDFSLEMLPLYCIPDMLL